MKVDDEADRFLTMIQKRISELRDLYKQFKDGSITAEETMRRAKALSEVIDREGKKLEASVEWVRKETQKEEIPKS